MTTYLRKVEDRKRAILNDTPDTKFYFESQKYSDVPEFRNRSIQNFYQRNDWGAQEVRKYSGLIDDAAKRYGIDPDIVKAIIYTEVSRGWYGYAPEHLNSMTHTVLGFEAAHTILPGNIGSEWQALIPGSDVHKPEDNIELTTKLISRIAKRLDDPSIENIYSLYNALGHDRTYVNKDVKTTPYFAKKAFEAKAWEKDNWSAPEPNEDASPDSQSSSPGDVQGAPVPRPLGEKRSALPDWLMPASWKELPVKPEFNAVTSPAGNVFRFDPVSFVDTANLPAMSGSVRSSPLHDDPKNLGGLPGLLARFWGDDSNSAPPQPVSAPFASPAPSPAPWPVNQEGQPDADVQPVRYLTRRIVGDAGDGVWSPPIAPIPSQGSLTLKQAAQAWAASQYPQSAFDDPGAPDAAGNASDGVWSPPIEPIPSQGSLTLKQAAQAWAASQYPQLAFGDPGTADASAVAPLNVAPPMQPPMQAWQTSSNPPTDLSRWVTGLAGVNPEQPDQPARSSLDEWLDEYVRQNRARA